MENGTYYEIQANKDTSFSLKLGVKICDYMFTGIAEKNGDFVNMFVYADMELNLSKFLNAAMHTFNLTLDIPKIFEIIVERLRVDYIKNVLSFECEFEGFLKKCQFSYEKSADNYLFAFSLNDFNLKNIPLLSEFVGDLAFGLTETSIIFSTTKAKCGSVDVDAGLSLAANLCGFKFVQNIKSYSKPVKKENMQIVRVDENHTAFNQSTGSAMSYWFDINKKLSILTLNRAGISYDQGTLGVILDLSVSIIPFTVSLFGAGLQVNIDTKDVSFLISGFGMEFDNGFLKIGGAFKKSGDKYAGGLTIGIKSFKITLVGIYEKNHFLSYALVNAPLGGPPAFFVTGIAAAFGYNKTLVLPEVDVVPKFPLVEGAIGKPPIKLNELITKLDNDKYINDCEGQKFISAGIKFTSFNIIESFVLLNVGFGNKVNFSILGVSNLSVPPMVDQSPIAFAQLALKVVLDPSDGIFSVQAQLTPESFIFHRDCKLTGGFAFFLWFGNHRNSGDFVLSLGGYHPDYKKPDHYPTVPRVGVNWKITDQLSITGELYFALTPSCIMTGVRMSALYKDGNLKAWFIVQADFLMQWKPFKYSAHACVSLGASYTVNALCIHHTFTIELSADMQFRGPEFSGIIHVKWFIISFTIKFGKESTIPPLKYGEFSDSFLPSKNDSATNKACALGNKQAQPLTISIDGKLYKEKEGVKYLNVDELSFLVSSAVPISGGDVVIRPMNNEAFTSEITYDAGIEGCTVQDSFQSVPTALWGGDGELRKVKSGYTLFFPETKISTFPKNKFISLDKLYELNTQTFTGYKFKPDSKTDYDTSGTIKIFTETVDKVNEARKAFLLKMGVVSPPDISLAIYAQNAEILFDEDILMAI